MSEQEQYEIQGRAHAALKQAKGKVATITLYLGEHSRHFSELGRLITQFAHNPAEEPMTAHLKETARRVDGDAIVKLIDELQIETARVAELQAQIDKF